MAQHRRANSSGQDSAVYLHLKEMAHSFEDSNVHILDREDRWLERGVKEVIYVKMEKPSLNRGGSLWHHLWFTMLPFTPTQEIQQLSLQEKWSFTIGLMWLLELQTLTTVIITEWSTTWATLWRTNDH